MERILSLLLLLLSSLSLAQSNLRLVVQLRAPGTRNPCALDISQDIPDKTIPTNCELSHVGEIQQHMGGAKFREQYIDQLHFMNNFYREKQIISKSAPQDICILSASSFLHGLYPVTEFKLTPKQIALSNPPIHMSDKESILAKLKDAPSLSKAQAIQTFPQISNPDNYVLNALQNCQEAQRHLQFLDENESFLNQYRAVGQNGAFQILSKLYGTPQQYLSPLDAFSVIQNIISLYYINPEVRPLPPSELTTLMQFYRFILVQGKLRDKKVTQLLTSDLLSEVETYIQTSIKQCKKQCKETEKQAAQRLKLLMYWLEEVRVFALMKLLGKENLFEVIEPASYLRLKLYSSSENSSDYFIKLEFNGHDFLTLSYQQFVKLIKQLKFRGNTKQACRATQDLRSSETVMTNIQDRTMNWKERALILILLVLISLSLVALIFWYEEKKAYSPPAEDTYLALYG